MTLILRPDLRCPTGGCKAAVVEYRQRNGTVEFRCKVHGPLLLPVKPLSRIGYNQQGVKS